MSRATVITRLVTVLILTTTVNGTILAQNTISGAIRGTVLDDNTKMPIPQARVTARHDSTGTSKWTVTFANGTYTIQNLPPGRYTLICEQRDYVTSTSPGAYINLYSTKALRVPPFLLRRKDTRAEIRTAPESVARASEAVARTQPRPPQTARSEPANLPRVQPAQPPSAQPPEAASPLPPQVAQPSPLPVPEQPAQATPLPAPPSPTPAGALEPQHGPTSPPRPAQPQPTPPRVVVPGAPPVESKAIEMVNSSNAMRGGNFTEHQLTSLPLPGIRTFDTLALLVPGVTDPPQVISESAGPGIGAGVGTSGQFSVNGMRGRANSFTVDGSDNNDQDVAVRRQGFLSLLPQSVESVQEFQISTLLWDAELGRNLGSQVNAVSKSGSNQLHGQIYGYVTDSRLNARNFFDYTARPSGDKNPFTRTQAGIAMAGPLAQDRTHVFGSFEHQKINALQEHHFSTPTESERQFQGFSSFKVITSPRSRNRLIDYVTTSGATPIGQNLLQLYPEPRKTAVGPYGANTLTRILPASGQGKVVSSKVTHQIASKHALAARYNFTDDERELPSVKRAISSTIDSRTRTQNLSLILDNAFSETFANQGRFSFGRTVLGFTRHGENSFLFINENPVQIAAFTKEGLGPFLATAFSSTGPVGELIVRPFSPVGLDAFTFPQRRVNNTFQYADTMSKMWSRHTFKFGVDIRLVQFNSQQDRNYRPLIEVNNGTLEIRDLDDPSRSGQRFLSGVQFASIGQVSSIFQTVTFGPPNSYIGLRFAELNFFVNDNWRVKPHFSLEYGIRYEYNTVPREVNDRIEDALSLQHLPAAGPAPFVEKSDLELFTAAFHSSVDAYRRILDGRTRIYDTDRNNFGPHLGFAWDPWKNGKTSIRGGYGIYYGTILGAVVSQSRNVFPTEVPFLSDATFFGHDGLSSNNPSFYGLGTRENFIPYFRVGSNQLGGGPGDFVPLVGSLFYRNREAGGLTFTLPEKELRTPYVQQWQLTFEREIGNYLISTAYVGTKGNKLTWLATPNGGPNVTPHQILTLKSGAPPTISFDTDIVMNQLPIRRDARSLGAYQMFENSANSNYHSLQLEVRKRFSHGLTLTAGHTWSHAIDDVSDILELAGAPAVAQDSSKLAAERASASYDVRHRFVASGILELPFYRARSGGSALWFGGWQVSSTFYARTGQPYTLDLPIDANLDGNLTDRPMSVAGLTFFDHHGQRRIQQGRDVTAFYVLGQNGFLGRNTVRADGLIHWDVAANKRLVFTDRRSLEFRAEIFNVLNRSNFGIPVRTIGNPGFGLSTNTVAPARIIQFALKVHF